MPGKTKSHEGKIQEKRNRGSGACEKDILGTLEKEKLLGKRSLVRLKDSGKSRATLFGE